MSGLRIVSRGKPELVECLPRQDAGAVNGTADGFVLLEDDDVEAALAEQASGVQAGRARRR